MQYESAFLISNPRLVINKLAILKKYKCLLTVSFCEDESPFITTILDVNKESIIFYHGPQPEQLEKLQQSDNITFKTTHQGVKVSFSGAKFNETRLNGELVYTMPIPDAIMWIEARDFYRVKIPVNKSAYCVLSSSGAEPVRLRLIDISLSGFSVINDVHDISKLINPNMRFKNCQLILTDWYEGNISFEIRHKFVFQAAHLRRTEKIGCKFTESTEAFENIVQGYMLQIEREYRQNLSADTIDSPLPIPKLTN